MKTLKIIGIVVAVAFVVTYWQWFLALAVFAGLCYAWDAWRKARIARHAACLAAIARMERELGIR